MGSDEVLLELIQSPGALSRVKQLTDKILILPRVLLSTASPLQTAIKSISASTPICGYSSGLETAYMVLKD